MVQLDIERGLVLVEGAVPGHAGGWIFMRDAVKKALPKEAPKPGKFRLASERALPHRAEAPKGEGDGREDRHHVTRRQCRRLDGTRRRDFRTGAARRSDRAHGALSARQAPAPARHAKNRAEIARTGKKMYKQKGTGGARHGSARVPQFPAADALSVRSCASHAHDLPKKVRALALKHALSAKAKDGGIIVWANPRASRCEDEGLPGEFAKIGVGQAR